MTQISWEMRRQVNIWTLFCTILEFWLAEVKVLAGSGRAVLRAQREAHRLDLLPQ